MHATKLDLRVWLAAIYTVLNSSKGRLVRGARQDDRHHSEMYLETRARDPGDDARGLGEQCSAFRQRRGRRDIRRRCAQIQERQEEQARQGHQEDTGDGGGSAAVRSGQLCFRGYRVRISSPRGRAAPDATMMTDGSSCSNFVGSAFPVHHRVIHSKKQFAVPATGAHVNTAEAFAAFIERARVGVYHRITGYHTQRCLDELTWRWNRREPVEEIRPDRKGKTPPHIRWKPPVLRRMRFLLKSAPGPEMRRSENHGSRWPAAALLGG